MFSLTNFSQRLTMHSIGQNWIVILGIFAFLTLSFAPINAQSNSLGQEPQSIENTDLQQAPTEVLPSSQFYRNGESKEVEKENQIESSNWMKKFEKRVMRRKARRPHRPIPAIMLVLGFLFLFFWIGLLLITALSVFSGGLFLVMLLLTILLSPLAVLGILFIIGGLVGLAV